MKAIVKTVDGGEFTFIGAIVKDLKAYYTQDSGTFLAKPLMWVGNGETFINFDHVISIQFFEMETEVGLSEFK